MHHAATIGEVGLQRQIEAAGPLLAKPRMQAAEADSFRDVLTANVSAGSTEAAQRSLSSGATSSEPMVAQTAEGQKRLAGATADELKKLGRPEEQTGHGLTAEDAEQSLPNAKTMQEEASDATPGANNSHGSRPADEREGPRRAGEMGPTASSVPVAMHVTSRAAGIKLERTGNSSVDGRRGVDKKKPAAATDSTGANADVVQRDRSNAVCAPDVQIWVATREAVPPPLAVAHGGKSAEASVEPVELKTVKPSLSVKPGSVTAVGDHAPVTERHGIPSSSSASQPAQAADTVSKVARSEPHGSLPGASAASTDVEGSGMPLVAAAAIVPGEHRAHLPGTMLSARADSVPMLLSRPMTTSSASGTDWKTTVATSNVLEVGISGGSHGWLRVRAELGQGGQVMASVLTASAGAAEGLHKTLPGLTAYLADEQVSISSLVVNATGKRGGTADDSLPQRSDGQGGAAQDSGTARDDRRRTGSEAWPAAQAARRFDEAGIASASLTMPALVLGSGGGGWLSVRV